jgi:hypothetical protein
MSRTQRRLLRLDDIKFLEHNRMIGQDDAIERPSNP